MAVQSGQLLRVFLPQVNSEGFFASEDGDVRAQRVLLSDVSTEAACVFLHYLYTADAALPPWLAPDLSSLAHRSGLFFLFMALTLTDRDPLVDGPWEGQGWLLPVPSDAKCGLGGDLEQGVLTGSLARAGEASPGFSFLGVMSGRSQPQPPNALAPGWFCHQS